MIVSYTNSKGMDRSRFNNNSYFKAMNSPMFTLAHTQCIVDKICNKHFQGKCYLDDEHVGKVKKFIDGEKDELSENLHLLTCILEGLCPMINEGWCADMDPAKIQLIYEGFDFVALESTYSTFLSNFKTAKTSSNSTSSITLSSKRNS